MGLDFEDKPVFLHFFSIFLLVENIEVCPLSGNAHVLFVQFDEYVKGVDFVDEVPFSDNSYLVSASDLENIGSDETIDNCELDIELQRQRKGTLDPAYGSGEIYGAVMLTQSILLTP